MAIEIDISRVPLDKRTDLRFVQIFNKIQNKLLNDQSFEEVCIHEGSHLLYFIQNGVDVFRVEGPFISYDAQADAQADPFDFGVATVRAVNWGSEFKRLDPVRKIHVMAIVCVAGEIGTRVLLGRSRGKGSGFGDREKFDWICKKAGIHKPHWAAIWKAAQKHVRRDLQRPEIQSGIRLAADEVKRLLLESAR